MKRFLLPLFGLVAISCFYPAVGTEPMTKTNIAVVAKGDNQFAFDLYAQLRGEEGNLFFSPYSISTALAMTRAGARGDTAAEMDQTLHFTLPPDELQSAFGALAKEVNGDPAAEKRGYQLNTANALWGQKGLPFKPDFLKLVNDNYGAGLNEVDFKGAPDQVRGVINAWVEKETRDKIKDLLQPRDITSDTSLVLTNAVYFKGEWEGQFKKALTKDEPFHLSADKRAKAPFMHQTAEYNYLDGGSFQLLELPYTGKDLTMVVLLPKKVDGLADFEKELNADKLASWIGKLHKQKVEVSLPKFKTTQRMSLPETLSAMGMKKAFTPRAADFSGMVGDPGEMAISDVIHKAFIDVNEEGAEAAAATAVVISRSVSAVKPPMPMFRADHPFVFLIRDTRSDSILFLGRLVDPAK